jgi:hypothetical protein
MFNIISRTMAIAVIATFMLALISAPVSLAQGNSGRVDDDVYTVQTGDTLYQLSGVYRNNPELWKEVLAVNPFLQEKGRLFERNDRIIVLIRPGEKLVGLGRLGITAKPVSIDRLQPAPVPVPTPTPVVDESWPLWAKIMIALLTLIVALIITIIISVMRGGHLARRLGVDSTEVPYNPLDPRNQNVAPRRERPFPPLDLPIIEDDDPVASEAAVQSPTTNSEPYRHPAEMGPAIVPGGVNDATASRQFMASAIRDYPELVVSHGVDAFRVISVYPITITSGTLTVLYKDGTSQQITVDPEHPLRAYRGMVTLPTGEVQQRFMLQACANDLRGSVSNYNLGSDVRWYEGHQNRVVERGCEITGTPEVVEAPVATTSTEPVSEAEQGALNLPGNLTTEKFFEEMIRLGVLTEEDARRAQLAQSEPSHIIAVDGDRVTVNGVVFVGPTGILLKRGVAVVLPTLDGIVELCISASAEISGFPAPSANDPAGIRKSDDADDDLAMATVS